MALRRLIAGDRRTEGREPWARPLTAWQEVVLAVIRLSLAERGHGPTAWKIGDRVGLSSTGLVAHQLGGFEVRGLITR
ncbi:hypothetical protein ABZX28_25905 [Streptomyces rubiginosohelvolus]|uniref:LexA family protein n=1 Tax=Streptomyces rubiginosohelvolus TaxID=67362 RepID=UPI00339E125D